MELYNPFFFVEAPLYADADFIYPSLQEEREMENRTGRSLEEGKKINTASTI